VTVFLVIGGIGLLIVLLSLVFDDLFDFIDLGGDLFSTPVVGSFLAAFGFAGALTSSTGAGAGVASAVGLGAGVGLGWAAWGITRGFMRMQTDEPVRLTDIVGKTAVVVSAIPTGGFGEVRVDHAGQPMKLNARIESGGSAPVGGRVVVLAVNSASSVVVESEGDFWGQPASLEE
jgi:hypothetical protein